MLLSFVTPSTTSYASSIAWARSFGPWSGPSVFPTPDPTGLLGGWGGGSSAILVLNLAALPLLGGGTLDLLPLVNANGFIDVNIADDTAVDYVRLVVHQCGATSYCTAKTSSHGCLPSIQSTDPRASPLPALSKSRHASRRPKRLDLLQPAGRAHAIPGRLVRGRTALSSGAREPGAPAHVRRARTHSKICSTNRPAARCSLPNARHQSWFRATQRARARRSLEMLEIWLCP